MEKEIFGGVPISGLELRHQYTRLSKIFHPDKVDFDLKETSQTTSDRITSAYRLLSNPLAMWLHSRYGPVGLGLLGKNPDAFRVFEERMRGVTGPPSPKLACEIDKVVAALFFDRVGGQRQPFSFKLTKMLPNGRGGAAVTQTQIDASLFSIGDAHFSARAVMFHRGQNGLGDQGDFRQALLGAVSYPSRLGGYSLTSSASWNFSTNRPSLSQTLSTGESVEVFWAADAPAVDALRAGVRGARGPMGVELSGSAAGIETVVKTRFRLSQRVMLRARMRLMNLGLAEIKTGLSFDAAPGFALRAETRRFAGERGWGVEGFFRLGFRCDSFGFILKAGAEFSAGPPRLFIGAAARGARVELPFAPPPTAIGTSLVLLGVAAAAIYGYCRRRARKLEILQAENRESELMDIQARIDSLQRDSQPLNDSTPQPLNPSEVEIISVTWMSRLDKIDSSSPLPRVDLSPLSKTLISYKTLLDSLSEICGKPIEDSLAEVMKFVVVFKREGKAFVLELEKGKDVDLIKEGVPFNSM